jgi:hypothetical protein
MLQTVTFRDRLIEGGVLDPEGCHHEFAYGAHGRKLDFGLIGEDHTLYAEWVDTNVAQLRRRPRLPRAVLGIANGTNQLAIDIASDLDIIALVTRKSSPRAVELSEESVAHLADIHLWDEVTAVEDVGTSGGSTLTGLQCLQAAGYENLSAQITWQRAETLGALATAGITYWSIIHEPLTTFEAAQCEAKGYCAQGWELISHD